MIFVVQPSKINGSVAVPGSKSHTIRALVLALLAEGESVIREPLYSSDTLSCYTMIKKFGAIVTGEGTEWHVTGRGGELAVPDDIIDTGNSGTSLYIGLGIASTVNGVTVFTGDHQIRNRPADALIASINDLGGEAFSTRGNGKPPVVVKGRLHGGTTNIEAVTSQYLTSLLIAAPFADGDTTIRVPLLNELPYVTMTLDWLDAVGILYENKNYREFVVPGNQRIRCFNEQIAADFSSATFFLVAAAIAGGEVELRGLDFSDTQGDKEVVRILQDMGADIRLEEKKIIIRGGELRGGIFDLNPIPDALPALSVAACFAEGETRLVNVPQARLKETDRIRVMYEELRKMGAWIEELPDGLVIRRSKLKGCLLDGHADHRVVMALSVAGLAAEGESSINTAESVAITFPSFLELMSSLGATMKSIKE